MLLVYGGIALLMVLAHFLFFQNTRIDTFKAKAKYRKNQVKNTILKNKRPVVECFNSYIASNPPITKGILKVDFEISARGQVNWVNKVMASFSDQVFINCVLGKVKGWQFPQAGLYEALYVDHTFRFNKRAEKAKPKR